ncbi:MAG: integration host factor subunit alpha [Methylobacteriaceae bacterium]|nr:integration host factor subunit alpha [Methylobacteriaceae bacterium]
MRKNLTRADLAEAIHPVLKLPRRDCAVLVDQVIGEIVETLAAGEEVKLSGFGTFQIRAKAERMGRNPKSGAPAAITPRRVVVFRASRVMKATLSSRAQAERKAASEPRDGG